MTGDRMINLAKTPGNIDFQSKYYRRAESTPHDGSFEATNSSATSAPASPTEESSHKESSTNQRQNVRSFSRIDLIILKWKIFHRDGLMCAQVNLRISCWQLLSWSTVAARRSCSLTPAVTHSWTRRVVRLLQPHLKYHPSHPPVDP